MKKCVIFKDIFPGLSRTKVIFQDMETLQCALQSSVLLLILASQPFIYGFAAVQGFIAGCCNLMVTFGNVHK